MNRNLNRRIHPIAEADGLSPKKPRKKSFIGERILNISYETYKCDERGRR